jgi:hypothetical protein
MAAQVDSDRLPATCGDCGRRPPPRAAGLTAAVQEHHGWRKWIAKAVSDDANTVNTVDAE